MKHGMIMFLFPGPVILKEFDFCIFIMILSSDKVLFVFDSDLLMCWKYWLAVCFQNQLMRHLPKSFTKHSKIKSVSSSQNWLAQILPLFIMLERWSVIPVFCSTIVLGLELDITNFVCFFQVQYQSDQFLDKNKDYVVREHQDLLSASKCSFVSGLFPPLSEETSKSSKFSSIGSRFKVYSSLSSLSTLAEIFREHISIYLLGNVIYKYN